MAALGIIFLFVALVLIGIGIALGAFAAALTFIMVTLGVVSSSVIVGLCKRSAYAGIRTFLLLSGALGGIPAGMFCAWFATTFMEVAGTNAKILFYGGINGAVCGLLGALMLDMIVKQSSRLVGEYFGTREKQPALAEKQTA